MLCPGYDHVIQIGYGKSGTTTVGSFFKHLGYNSDCFEWNDVKESLFHRDWPLSRTLKKCKHVYVSELSQIYFPTDNFHLQLTHMNSIRTNMPSKTLYVHCQRNTDKWVRSVSNWNSLFRRFKERDIDGLPTGHPKDNEELGDWYDHVNAYLGLVFRHMANYVKVDVESEESLHNLSSLCNATYRWVPLNVNRRYNKTT